MISSFEKAFDTLIQHEGGFVNDPNDPGGATNWGISLRFLKRNGLPSEEDDIYNMTRDDAKDIYKNYWWDKYKYYLLPERIGSKVFNISVNVGPSSGHRFLQRACQACGREVVIDGYIGKETRGAVNSVDEDHILSAYRSEAAGYYRLLSNINPNMQIYLGGWLKRAYS